MAKASGKYAQAISDRSGFAFPYTEMIKEYNAQALDDARPKRNEPMTVFLGGKGFLENTGSMNPVNRKPTVFASYVGLVTVSIS